jgi:hypothetical protein
VDRRQEIVRMLGLAVVIGIVTVAATWLATTVFITWSAQNWGKEDPRWREWSVGDSFKSGLLTVPASTLWTGVPGLLGFGLAGEGGALVAVIVMAVLTGLGLVLVGGMSRPG